LLMKALFGRQRHLRGFLAALALAATRSHSEEAPWRELATPVAELPARNPAMPQTKGNALVHLFEWKWVDIARECEEWLGPKGFTAVQVSPPNDHIVNEAWWARYQPVTYQLTSRSGTEEEFVEMVNVCKRNGVGIYVDAVMNHVASGAGTSIAGSPFGGRRTPIFEPADFHHNPGNLGANCGINNYNNKFNVQYCDMLGMPDLCTGCEQVKQRLSAWLTSLVELGVAGFRIDAAKHMDAAELAGLLGLVAPGHSVYWFQEVYAGEGEAVTMGMYLGTGALEYFDYSKQLAPNFMVPGKLKYMHNFGEGWGLLEQKYSLVFLDNHDTQRAEALLSYKAGALYQLATIFMLAHPYGYPKIMSSFYFNTHDQGPPTSPVHEGNLLTCGGGPQFTQPPPGKPWVCEHRWTAVANMVGWRRAAGDNDVGAFWAPNGNNMFFCRGKTACIAFNRDPHTWWRHGLKLPLPPGLYCNVILSDNIHTCPLVSVDEKGVAFVKVPPLGAVALHVFKMTHQVTTTGAATQTTTTITITKTITVPPTSTKTLTTTTSRTTTTTTITKTKTTTKLTQSITSTTTSLWVPGEHSFTTTNTTTTTVRTTTTFTRTTSTQLQTTSTTKNYLDACVSRSVLPGGLCYWGSGPSGQICNIQVTLQCCRASGLPFTECCKMKKIQNVPEAFREQAGVQECFPKDDKDQKEKTCATNDENCAKFGCCEDEERDCYEKNQWWAGCLPNCTQGMTDSFGDAKPWDCKRIEEPQKIVV